MFAYGASTPLNLAGEFQAIAISVREGYPARHFQSRSYKQRTTPYNSIRTPTFLGLTNYCAWYIPGYSTITFVLQQLTKNDVKFHWEHKHEKAFQSLKDAITTAPLLAQYSLTAETKVVVDASPWAVGAVLLQKQADDSYRPIAYGSKSLTEVERKYTVKNKCIFTATTTVIFYS